MPASRSLSLCNFIRVAFVLLGSLLLARLAHGQTNIAPQFTTQPADVSTYDGYFATFSAAATGTPSPTYRWQMRTTASAEWTDLTNTGGFSGADTSWLSFSARYALNGYEFRCQATNSEATVASSAARLTVVPQKPSIFSNLPSTVYSATGLSVTFTASVGGTAPLTFTWRFNGTPIPGATSSTLTLSDLQPAHAGKYSFVATNVAGSTTSTDSTLALVGPPTIASAPTAVVVALGESFQLSATVTSGSNAPVSYQWYRDDQPIAGATSSTYSASNVDTSAAGSYRLTATNVAGSVSTAPATVEVVQGRAPSVGISISGSQVEGQTTTLQGNPYAGTGPFTYQWYRNRVALPGETGPTLTLANLSPALLGEYIIAVQGATGAKLSGTVQLDLANPTGSAPTTDWVGYAESAGVHYFAFADTPRVERYDRTTGSWLASFALSAPPKAIAANADYVVVASARQLVRYDRTLGQPFVLANFSEDVRAIGFLRGFLVSITASSTFSTPTVRVHRVTDGQVLSTTQDYQFSRSAYTFDDAGGRLVGLNYPSLRSVTLLADGTGWQSAGSISTTTDSARFPLVGSRRYAIQQLGSVCDLDASANVAHAGSAVDDAVDDGAGGYFVLRRGSVVHLDASWRELASKTITRRGSRLAFDGSDLFVFAQPRSGSVPAVERISPNDLTPPIVAPAQPAGSVAVLSPQIEVSPDGIVHIFSKLHGNVLRWSAATWNYLPGLPLAGMPSGFALSAAHGAFYYNSGMRIARGDLATGGYAPVATGIFRADTLTTGGPWLFDVEEPLTSFGSGREIVVRDRDLQVRSRFASDAQALVWSEAQQALVALTGTSLYRFGFDASGARISNRTPVSLLNSASPPVRVSPLGTQVLLGNGRIYDLAGTDQQVGTILGSFVDAVWTPARLIVLRPHLTGSRLVAYRTSDFSEVASVVVPSRPERIFLLKADRVLLVTADASSVPEFRMFAALDLAPIDPSDANARLAFNEEPAPVSGMLGTPVILQASTRGGPLPNFRWQRREAGSETWVDLSDGETFSGTQSAQLLIRSLGEADARAQFRVIATSTAGQIVSRFISTAPGGVARATGVASANHSVVWREDGSAWTMGIGNGLADGTAERRYQPVQVASDIAVATAGNYATLLLDRTGRLFGTAGYGSSPGMVANDVVRASVDGSSVLFLKSNGELWGRGLSVNGRLGHRALALAQTDTPVLVARGVAEFAAGSEYTLYVLADGTLWAMGRNNWGELGVGPTDPNLTVAKQVAQDVRGVWAAGTHSVFLQADGTLWGMGRNTTGQLGQGENVASSNTPVLIASGVRTAAVGAAHTLILKKDGTVWACGDNTTGALGDGTLTTRFQPTQVAADAVAIACSAYGSWLLKADGSLWGTGSRSDGVFGGDSTGPSTLKVWTLVDSGLPVATTDTPTSLAATNAPGAALLGWRPVRGALRYEIFRSEADDVATAVKIGETLDAWPAFADRSGTVDRDYRYWTRPVTLGGPTNFSNVAVGRQIGPRAATITTQSTNGMPGTNGGVLLTVDVEGNPRPTFRWQRYDADAAQWIDCEESYPFTNTRTDSLSIAIPQTFVGVQFRCVIANPLGTVISTPVTVQARSTDYPTSLYIEPTDQTVPINYDAGFSAVVQGSYVFTYQWEKDRVPITGATDSYLAIRKVTDADAGSYRCRITMDGAREIISREAVLTVAPAIPAVSLDAAATSGFFIDARTTAMAFGTNSDYQLGINTGAAVTAPTALPYGWPDPLVRVRTGGQHTIVISSIGNCYATGVGTNGSFGDGRNRGRSSLWPLDFVAADVATGTAHSLFLSTTGVLYSAGQNESGQLGLGHTTMQGARAQVTTEVRAVFARGNTSFFIKGDDSLWAMGANASGQLGDNSTTNRLSPVPIATGVRSVAPGPNHTLFVKWDGTLWGMGANLDGSLGTAPAQVLSPVQLASGVTHAAVGAAHSVYLKNDGTLWTMGRNDRGQQGDGTLNPVTIARQLAANVSNLAAGDSFTLYTSASGEVYGVGAAIGWAAAGTGSSDALTPRRTWPVQSMSVPPAPTGVTATDNATAPYVFIRWNHTPRTQCYEIWRGTTASFGAATLISRSAAPLCYDYQAPAGVMCYYWIRAVNQAGTSAVTGSDTGVRAPSSSVIVITAHPSSQTVSAGGYANFSVSTASYGYTYQWRRNSVPLAGQTNSYLNLNVRSLDDDGDYDVVITTANGDQTATSLPARLTVTRGTQSLSLPPLPRQVFTVAPLSLVATASSGLPVTLRVTDGPASVVDGKLVLSNIGRVTVEFSQAGNESFLPAVQTAAFDVYPNSIAPRLENLASFYDGTAKTVLLTDVPSGAPLIITYDGSTTAPTNVGTYAVEVRSSDPRWLVNAAGRLTISPAPQTITFGPLGDRPFTFAPLTLSASASSGLPVSYSLIGGPAQLAGTRLTLTGLGSVIVDAQQSGNANYQPAAMTRRTFQVLNSFDYWRSLRFNEAQLADLAISGASATPFPNGVPNLVRYAVGMSDDEPTGSVLADLALTSGIWSARFRLAPALSDINVSVETSTDLVNWSTSGVAVQRLSSEPDGSELWEATRPVSGSSPVFFRLKVERP